MKNALVTVFLTLAISPFAFAEDNTKIQESITDSQSMIAQAGETAINDTKQVKQATEGSGDQIDPETQLDRVVQQAEEIVETHKQKLKQNRPVTLQYLDARYKALVSQLSEQKILTDEMLKSADKKAEAILEDDEFGKSSQSVIRVPYITDSLKQQMQDKLRGDLRSDVLDDVMSQAKTQRWGIPGAQPSWISTIKWNGDVRLRGQSDLFQNDNAKFSYFDIQELNDSGGFGGGGLDKYLNTTTDRHRLRIRSRLGMSAKLDRIKAKFRISTGNTRSPVSTNQTLGNMNNRYGVVWDRAYLSHTVTDLDGADWLVIDGGRIPSPWFSTDLAWDSDLAFEGIATKFRFSLNSSDSLFEQETQRNFFFATFGAFMLDEVELSLRDKALAGAQVGFEWNFENQSQVMIGVAYYDYLNMTGRRNSIDSELQDYTAADAIQKGNTLFDIRNDDDVNTDLWALASDYNIVDVTARVKWTLFAPINVVLQGSAVKNIGYDVEDIQSRTGGAVISAGGSSRDLLDERTKGYTAKLTVGWPIVNSPGAWSVSCAYRYLERDAVLDAFADSDFHLGGTDAQGWIMNVNLGMTENTWMSAKWLTSDEIDGAPFGVDVLQIDINSKF